MSNTNSMITVQQLGGSDTEVAFQQGQDVSWYAQRAGMSIGSGRQVNVNGKPVDANHVPEPGAVISIAKNISNG